MPRLGVVGTLVWDTIVPHAAQDDRFTGWGGIAYSFEALDAVLANSWEVFPIVKVGRDLHDEARQMLGTLQSVGSLDGLVCVSEPNNRVELRYTDPKRRREILTGGVPGWTWSELQPLADRCDALYVNFIAGWELDRSAVERLGAEYDRPSYLDVHSLVLDVSAGGDRVPRRLENWEQWLGSFDIVQLNDDELGSLVPGDADPMQRVSEILDGRPSALLVTRGREPVLFVACENVERWPAPSTRGEPCERVRGEVPVEETVTAADPTGCGDVWGAVCFGSLLETAALEEALRRANRAATVAARHRGAAGLAGILREENHR